MGTIRYSSSNFCIKFSIIQSMNRRFLVGTSFTTATFAASGLMRKTVSCQDNQNTDKLNTKTDDTTNQISNLVGPIVGQLGFGGVMGFATGYAFKKAAKITVMIVGGSFVILQGLSYSGVIQLDWKSIEKGVHQTLDRTGDGKVDQNDLSTMVQKVMSVLQ